MHFYEVLGDGYHTALTSEQVEGLVRAGRIDRNTPCKRLEARAWRTVDELFPLLKYGALVGHNVNANPVSHQKSKLLVSGAAIIALTGYVMFQALTPPIAPIISSTSDAAISASAVEDPVVAEPAPAPVEQRVASHRAAAAPAARPAPTTPDARVSQIVAAPTPARQMPAQQQRLAAPPASAPIQEKAASATREVTIPLDVYTVVHDVGGSEITLKIHDTDVSSIDVWTSRSGRPVRVTKQKGISGSRADETLIYSTGRASLYYVWEISGTLNHCLLRVREQ